MGGGNERERESTGRPTMSQMLGQAQRFKSMWGRSGNVSDAQLLDLFEWFTELHPAFFLKGLAGDVHAREEAMLRLLTAAQLVELKPGQVLYEEGSSVEDFYIVLTGAVNIRTGAAGVSATKRSFRTVLWGEAFGTEELVAGVSFRTSQAIAVGPELTAEAFAKPGVLQNAGGISGGDDSTYHNAYRDYIEHIRALHGNRGKHQLSQQISSVQVLRIPRVEFSETLGVRSKRHFRRIPAFLQNMALFNHLEVELVNTMAAYCSHHKILQGHYVVRNDYPVHEILLVYKGELVLSLGGVACKSLPAGSVVLGNSALRDYAQKHDLRIMAQLDSVVLSLRLELVENGRVITDSILHEDAVAVLRETHKCQANYILSLHERVDHGELHVIDTRDRVFLSAVESWDVVAASAAARHRDEARNEAVAKIVHRGFDSSGISPSHQLLRKRLMNARRQRSIARAKNQSSGDQKNPSNKSGHPAKSSPNNTKRATNSRATGPTVRHLAKTNRNPRNASSDKPQAAHSFSADSFAVGDGQKSLARHGAALLKLQHALGTSEHSSASQPTGVGGSNSAPPGNLNGKKRRGHRQRSSHVEAKLRSTNATALATSSTKSQGTGSTGSGRLSLRSEAAQHRRSISSPVSSGSGPSIRSKKSMSGRQATLVSGKNQVTRSKSSRAAPQQRHSRRRQKQKAQSTNSLHDSRSQWKRQMDAVRDGEELQLSWKQQVHHETGSSVGQNFVKDGCDPESPECAGLLRDSNFEEPAPGKSQDLAPSSAVAASAAAAGHRRRMKHLELMAQMVLSNDSTKVEDKLRLLQLASNGTFSVGSSNDSVNSNLNHLDRHALPPILAVPTSGNRRLSREHTNDLEAAMQSDAKRIARREVRAENLRFFEQLEEKQKMDTLRHGCLDHVNASQSALRQMLQTRQNADCGSVANSTLRTGQGSKQNSSNAQVRNRRTSASKQYHRRQSQFERQLLPNLSGARDDFKKSTGAIQSHNSIKGPDLHRQVTEIQSRDTVSL